VSSGVRCRYCRKLLPEGHSSGVCPLCASGLLPTGQREFVRDREQPMVVDSRQLSGVDCPCGRAELTWADLERGVCSICGMQFSPEELARLRISAGHGGRHTERRY
jgi:hypothetical protein